MFVSFEEIEFLEETYETAAAADDDDNFDNIVVVDDDASGLRCFALIVSSLIGDWLISEGSSYTIIQFFFLS